MSLLAPTIPPVGIQYACTAMGVSVFALAARGFMQPLKHFEGYGIRPSTAREVAIVRGFGRTYAARNLAMSAAVLSSVYYGAWRVTGWTIAAGVVVALIDGLTTTSLLDVLRTPDEKRKGDLSGAIWLHHPAIPLLAGLAYALLS